MHPGVTTETREASLCLSQHIPFPIPRDSSSKLRSFRAWKAQPQALPANFCTSGSSSETEGFLPHRSDPWKAGRNKWNYFISPHFPHNRDVGKSSQGKVWGKHQEPFLHHIPHGKQHMLGLGATGTPQIPPKVLQPSLPYELAGQMLHKVIDLIPVMQDTSWSRNTMIIEHISLSFPSCIFCHTLLSEAFDSVLFNTHCPCSSCKERSNCNWHFLHNFKKQEQFPLRASVWGCPWH